VPGSLISLLISGDELLSDSFPYKEIENGVLWEVEGKVSIFFLFPGLNFLFLLSNAVVKYSVEYNRSCQYEAI